MTTPTPSKTPRADAGIRVSVYGDVRCDMEVARLLELELNAERATSATLARDLAAADRALSLLASVEGSSDEVVRELQRVVLPSLRDYGQGYSAAVAERAASHIIALRAELASVKAHAEAMATKHEEIRTASVREIDRMEAQLHEAVDAYRAAHPKENK